jgi:hypothetical protein
MAKKNTTIEAIEGMASRVTILEGRITALEKLTDQAPKKARKVKEYTDEERAAIRARFVKGQEAARKKREAETKATKKVKSVKSEKVKVAETEKPTEA